MQETHLDDIKHVKLQQGTFGQVFFLSFTTRSRGVAIRWTLPLKVLNCVKHKNDHYVIIKGSLQGQGILIINVSYPPAYPSDFLTKVFLDLSEMTQ